MSAFIVSDAHIDLLVTYAVGGGPHRVSGEDPQKLGQMLLNENYRSVNHRYREQDETPRYRFVPFTGPIRPTQVISCCDCYDYQACETDDYRETEAARLVSAIRRKAIRQALPALADEKWGVDINPGRSSGARRLVG